ncbi:hypothetical protein BASA61_006080 [Batrachochytrium salamandrivorans]|nr:hypothetical protein BASA61_006080 [Batrachochytrium salamandrivorans]
MRTDYWLLLQASDPLGSTNLNYRACDGWKQLEGSWMIGNGVKYAKNVESCSSLSSPLPLAPRSILVCMSISTGIDSDFSNYLSVARLTVNQEVGGSSPPGSDLFLLLLNLVTLWFYSVP